MNKGTFRRRRNKKPFSPLGECFFFGFFSFKGGDLKELKKNQKRNKIVAFSCSQGAAAPLGRPPQCFDACGNGMLLKASSFFDFFFFKASSFFDFFFFGPSGRALALNKITLLISKPPLAGNLDGYF